MRVVTIEKFGVLTPEFTEHPGFIYQGYGWLLRFVIQSPDHFFENELNNLCNVLKIDKRQIYDMSLYGNGSGLYDARLHISFKRPPRKTQIRQLKVAVPSSSSCDYEGDSLDSRFREFLRSATPKIKAKVEKALQEEKLYARKESQSN